MNTNKMPYSIVKMGKGYGVKNTATGKFKSKNTTRANAMAQMRLLQGVEHGWQPTKKAKRVVGYKTVVDKKLRYFGDTDYNKKLIRINPKKGEVVNTMIHERLHMRYPDMKHKQINKLARKIEKKMPLKEQAKMLIKLARSKTKQ